MTPRAAAAILFLLAGCCAAESRDDPAGRVQRLSVTRDTVVSAFEGERDANLGGAERLKTKGIVELTLFDVDVEPLRGRTVASATLHVRAASQDVQRRVTVSSLASPWSEGTSSSYRPQPGSSSFDWAAQGTRAWAHPGSDVTAVINGGGHTAWSFSDATPPSPEGWQRIAVSPAVLATRVAGISHGFALTDDLGNEYDRDGDRFVLRVSPNRHFWSREAGPDRAPYVTVVLAGIDDQPPDAVVARRTEAIDAATLPAGESLARWATPSDPGGAGTAGFLVRLSSDDPFVWERAAPVPRYLIPAAASPGELVTLRLRDLDLTPGARITLGIKAVDGAGNVGELTLVSLPVAPRRAPLLALEGTVDAASPPPNPRLGDVEVFAVDGLDKVRPDSGEMIPPHPASYRRANHLWSGARRRVRLQAARNEFVDFQLVLAGDVPSTPTTLRFEWVDTSLPPARIHLLGNVRAPGGPLPDPLLPYPSAMRVPAAGGERFRSYLVELYVPHAAPPGNARGRLVAENASGRLEIGVELEIWSFTLPDYLSFVPQMNAYALPEPPADLALYRLAHEHRTSLNRLPYNWRGEVAAGYRVADRSGRFDWRRFDRRFGALLDGTAFAGLPRGGVPVDAFYLPINENWPASIDAGFRGGYWADSALGPDYRRRFVAAGRAFTEHVQERGWLDTFFELYLNNKLTHKRDGWQRSSAPWIFDEPINTQDFWALRWYGHAFHEGVAAAFAGIAPPLAKVVFRADVSRPQWQRDLLDGVLDVNVVGVGLTPYARRVMARKRDLGEIVYSYGTPNAIHESNAAAVVWCLHAWSLGADGVVPWQTIGGTEAWREATATALFYPAREGLPGPQPGLRLKAFRRGQQDAEYLTLLHRELGIGRELVGLEVLRLLELEGGSQQAGGVGAVPGPEALWRLRRALGDRLSRLQPEPRRRLVNLRTPPRGGPARADADYLVVLGVEPPAS